MNQFEKLVMKVEEGNARTAVIGLGYVGLPLLTAFAGAGYDALGIDIDSSRIKSIRRGKSYIQDIDDAEMSELVDSGKLTVTDDYSRLADADVVSICVPTPLRKSKSPDISYIVDALSRMSEHIKPGMLIILESTTYPGTTEEIVLPMLTGRFRDEEYSDICRSSVLEQAQEVLMKAQGRAGEFSVPSPGSDFFLAFSPERVDPGNPVFKAKDIPKVVGGVTERCCRIASLFYEKIFPSVIRVSSTRTAEMVKLMENTFRSVNIALANEMALMSDSLGVDIWEVIEAASSKPFGFMPFYPGPGLGGHCIPIDPLYLTWKAKVNGFDPKFIELAGELNRRMPKYVVSKVQDRLNGRYKSLSGSRVMVIGVAYKKNVSDTRESPSVEIIKLLRKKGADVAYHDPMVPRLLSETLDMFSVELNRLEIIRSDCVIIATDHSMIDYELIEKYADTVVDTRGVTGKRKKAVAEGSVREVTL